MIGGFGRFAGLDMAGLAVALALAGCSTSPALRASAELPPAARALPARYVVVTVRNPRASTLSRAASTPGGYDAMGPYAAGSGARRTAGALAADYHLEETSSWPIALLGVHCLVYALPAGVAPELLLERLARDARVESAQPLQSFETLTTPYNDPYSTLQHNLAQMAVADAHALSRGDNVRVAIIDSGVAVDHPDFPRHLTTRNFVDNDVRAFSEDAHGTAVAGVIAAVPDNGVGIVGIAPDVRLLLYKACWRAEGAGIQADCNSFTLAQALSAAVEARVDIINLSLAGPTDPLLTRLVERAVAAGIIVVGAVPADGKRDHFPTNIEGVVAVDALESGHTTGDVLRAPGRDIISLAPNGSYDFYSGSSLATAEISGLIALLRAERPRLTAIEAARLLSSAATSAPREGSSGAPNACVAIAKMLQRPACGSP
jgi:hypothetical protein